MDLKRLSNKAKDLVEKRGGSDSVKEDAAELRKIADGRGSLGDKAKAAAAAIKKPGGAAPAAEESDGAAATAAAHETEKAEHEGGRDGDPAV